MQAQHLHSTTTPCRAGDENNQRQEPDVACHSATPLLLDCLQLVALTPSFARASRVSGAVFFHRHRLVYPALPNA